MEGDDAGGAQDEAFLFEHESWVCPANCQVSGYTDSLYFVSNWHSCKVHEFTF